MSESANEINSFLLPLANGDLVIPDQSVSELLPFMNVDTRPAEGKPTWFVGLLNWRGQKIPLLSLEAMSGPVDLSEIRRSRIAVITTLNQNARMAHVALLVTGIPRLMQVTPDNCTLTSDTPDSIGVKAVASLEGKEVMIPDLEVLESKALDAVA